MVALGSMSVAEIIEEIRALPREDRDKVVELVAREFAPSLRKMSFEEASSEVFTEYRELLEKLSK